MKIAFIDTQRLILRTWQESYLQPFAAMNEDPRVMEYFPSLLTIDETAALIQKIHQHMQRYGFGLFACTLKESAEFIGFVGLSTPSFQAHFTPCLEIGWRLAASHWHKGYATEAALAVLAAGFERYALEEIVSFTVPTNHRSIRVMEKLGMIRNPADDFNHPNLLATHPLRQHLLYRISKSQWQQQPSTRVK